MRLLTIAIAILVVPLAILEYSDNLLGATLQENADKEIDLLKLIDPHKDAVVGEWKPAGGSLLPRSS